MGGSNKIPTQTIERSIEIIQTETKKEKSRKRDEQLRGETIENGLIYFYLEPRSRW